ncbi:M15 family metallopeptidase [Lachnospiraceae bacterium LCP25S3_G4]
MKDLRKLIVMIGTAMLLLGLGFGRIWGMNAQDKGQKMTMEKPEDIKEASAHVDAGPKVEANVKSGSENPTQVNEQVQQPQEIPWNLILVNSSHPLQEGYIPELGAVVDGYNVDVRIVDPLQRMLAAAQQEGMSMHICSAYRSVERQKEVFNQTMQDHIANGATYLDAYNITKQSVAVPGTSEHELGLAVDIVSDDYALLDDGQANTKEARWLQDNCYKFGFILRYPPEKTNETGIIYESWHYRYVGEEIATQIMQSGVTFEEFLGEEE